MLKKEANQDNRGPKSAPGKMPEGSYNLPARACQTGAKLQPDPGHTVLGLLCLQGPLQFSKC